MSRIREAGGVDDIHVIGFSLGAQVANYIANVLKPYLLPRITGLDPALPLFMTSNKQHKLDPSDARFVDVYHCNVRCSRRYFYPGNMFCSCQKFIKIFSLNSQGLMQGQIERTGSVDFYMNGGVYQPGCGSGEHEKKHFGEIFTDILCLSIKF